MNDPILVKVDKQGRIKIPQGIFRVNGIKRGDVLCIQNAKSYKGFSIIKEDSIESAIDLFKQSDKELTDFFVNDLNRLGKLIKIMFNKNS